MNIGRTAVTRKAFLTLQSFSGYEFDGDNADFGLPSGVTKILSVSKSCRSLIASASPDEKLWDEVRAGQCFLIELRDYDYTYIVFSIRKHERKLNEIPELSKNFLMRTYGMPRIGIYI